tara:strand:+ start:5603 stop:5884 length:282 start_codon:yes stop_codon:yes gene_type:complete
MRDNYFVGLGDFIEIEVDHVSTLRRDIEQEHIQWTFPNGYGGSLACNQMTYGDPEFAVLKDGKLHYKTDITSDVIRPVNPSEVQDFLNKLKRL